MKNCITSGQSSLIQLVLIIVPLIMINVLGTNMDFHGKSGFCLILFQEK